MKKNILALLLTGLMVSAAGNVQAASTATPPTKQVGSALIAAFCWNGNIVDSYTDTIDRLEKVAHYLDAKAADLRAQVPAKRCCRKRESRAHIVQAKKLEKKATEARAMAKDFSDGLAWLELHPGIRNEYYLRRNLWRKHNPTKFYATCVAILAAIDLFAAGGTYSNTCVVAPVCNAVGSTAAWAWSFYSGSASAIAAAEELAKQAAAEKLENAKAMVVYNFGKVVAANAAGGSTAPLGFTAIAGLGAAAYRKHIQGKVACWHDEDTCVEAFNDNKEYDGLVTEYYERDRAVYDAEAQAARLEDEAQAARVDDRNRTLWEGGQQFERTAVDAASTRDAKVEAAELEAARVKAEQEAARVKAAELEAARVTSEAWEAEQAELAHAARVKAEQEAARVKAAELEAARVKAAELEAARVKAAELEAARAQESDYWFLGAGRAAVSNWYHGRN